MAGFMDFFSQATGGQAGGLNDLLTEEQRRAINQQSMMSMAAQLLQAGGPSDKRTSLGQALGQGFTAAQKAQQSGQTDALTQMLTRQKIDEFKKSNASSEAIRQMLLGKQPGATDMNAAQAALAAPSAGPAGPTIQRAQLMDTAPRQPDPLGFLSPTQRALIAAMPSADQAKYLTDAMASANKFGAPSSLMINGKPTVVQFNEQGAQRVIPNAMPYEAQPEGIRATEYLQGRSLAGTGPAGMQQVGEYRKQIAPQTTVNLPGPNDFLKGAGGIGSERLGSEMNAAISANNTLRNIDTIAPALDKAILGPGADYRTVMTRVGQQLGVAGKDSQEQLNNTRQVVQGLATAELEASAGMKGQGEITASERTIIKRMAAGDQNMTADEIRVGMAAMQKNAQYRQQAYSGTLQRAGTIPGFAGVAPMFQVDQYKPQTQLGGMLNFGSAINAELQKRQGNPR